MALGDISQSLAEAPQSYMDDAAIKRKRLLAEQLMMQGADTSPIRSPWQGAARLVQGLMGGLNASSADAAEKENNDHNSKLMAGLLSPSAAVEGGASPAPASRSVAPAQPEGGSQSAILTAADKYGIPHNVALAMARQESSNNPNAPHGGLFQITQGTAAKPGYGVQPVNYASLSDPATNADFAMRYLAARNPGINWNDPAAVDRALRSYNGGGDPNYVQHVRRFIPQDASAPVQVASNDAAGAFGGATPPAQNGQAQRILAAMADPRLSPQNKQILAAMYANATKDENKTRFSEPYTDAQGNMVQRDSNGQLHVLRAAPQAPVDNGHPFVMGEEPDGMGGTRKVYGTMQNGKPVPLTGASPATLPHTPAASGDTPAPQIPPGVDPKEYLKGKAKSAVKKEDEREKFQQGVGAIETLYNDTIAAYQKAIEAGAIGKVSASGPSRAIGSLAHSPAESARRGYETNLAELKTLMVKKLELMKGQGNVSNADMARIDSMFPALDNPDPQQALNILKRQKDIVLGFGSTSPGSSASGSVTTADQPPYPGAQKAPDGHWYVKQNDKFFRVDN